MLTDQDRTRVAEAVAKSLVFALRDVEGGWNISLAPAGSRGREIDVVDTDADDVVAENTVTEAAARFSVTLRHDDPDRPASKHQTTVALVTVTIKHPLGEPTGGPDRAERGRPEADRDAGPGVDGR